MNSSRIEGTQITCHHHSPLQGIQEKMGKFLARTQDRDRGFPLFLGQLRIAPENSFRVFFLAPHRHPLHRNSGQSCALQGLAQEGVQVLRPRLHENLKRPPPLGDRRGGLRCELAELEQHLAVREDHGQLRQQRPNPIRALAGQGLVGSGPTRGRAHLPCPAQSIQHPL